MGGSGERDLWVSGQSNRPSPLLSKQRKQSNGCAGGTVGVERSVREREVKREKPLVEVKE